MKKNDNSSRQLLLWISIWFLVLGLSLVLSEYWEMRTLKSSLHEYFEQTETVKGESFAAIEQTLKRLGRIYWPVLAASLAVIGFFLWLTLRSSLMRMFRKDEATTPLSSEQKKQEEIASTKASLQEKKDAAANDQRRALHLLSLLQREGRLVDFLREDLEAYDDAQIGVAVRNIQESCQKTLNKYLAPSAVIEKNEGDEVTVDSGFDAGAVKLTGNVAGEPPFKGILQHRGWRTTAFDLPTLSGSQDPSIIAPAEVEIE